MALATKIVHILLIRVIDEVPAYRKVEQYENGKAYVKIDFVLHMNRWRFSVLYNLGLPLAQG